MVAAATSIPIVGYAAYAPFGMEGFLIPHLAPGMTRILADGDQLSPPGVEGFGRCLLQAIRQMFAHGHTAACVLSADTPTLPTGILIAAATILLTGNDRRAVIGACDDGGYYLLGMRAPHANLFADIAWSTSSVAAATRERAVALDLDIVELPTWYDIDDTGSLQRLLGESEGYPAPWTRRTIEAFGLHTLLAA